MHHGSRRARLPPPPSRAPFAASPSTPRACQHRSFSRPRWRACPAGRREASVQPNPARPMARRRIWVVLLPPVNISTEYGDQPPPGTGDLPSWARNVATRTGLSVNLLAAEEASKFTREERNKHKHMLVLVYTRLQPEPNSFFFWIKQRDELTRATKKIGAR
jgi:hypothetical protein